MTKPQRLRHNWLQFLLAVDQLANTIIGMLFFWCGYEAYADETISARSYRGRSSFVWRVLMHLINALFCNKNHCHEAFLSELNKQHLPDEYKA